jgi:hypothetical protein
MQVIVTLRRRRLLVSLSIVVALMGCQNGSQVNGRTSDAESPSNASSVGLRPPQPDAPVVASWQLSMPEDIAFAAGSVWVPSHRDPQVTTRIDPQSNAVTATIRSTGRRAKDAIAVDGSVWVSGQVDDTVRIDVRTNRIVAKVPGAHTYLADGFGAIWATTSDDRLDRINRRSGRVSASIPLNDGLVDCDNAVFTTSTAVWVDHCDEQELVRIDPATNTITSKTPYADLARQAEQRTAGNSASPSLWIDIAGGLLQVDPTKPAGRTFLPLTDDELGDGWVTATPTAVWQGGNGQVERIDPVTDTITSIYRTHAGVAKVGVGVGSVWLAFESQNLLQRLAVAP